jgi:hypothetical protein
MTPSGRDPRPCSTPIDLSDPALRERLSADAARAFLNIVACWQLSDEDACQLLDVSNATLDALKIGEGGPLDEEHFKRISFLVGIFKALNIIFLEPIADRWMRLPNTSSPFVGSPPLDYLIRDGLPAFAAVRRLLEARVAGG